MSLYQTSVLKQHLKLQDQDKLDKAYKKYSKYFLNPTIQDNIRTSKEEEYQGIFLTELFVNILEFTLKPKANFNLVAEYKNQTNSRKADGAILHNNVAIGVIELKGTNTKDLESIRKQAFDYKANQKGCVYIITSNFEKLRFYINDATEFEEFNLFELTKARFQLFYLCLQKDNILNHVPLKIKEASIVVEEQITKQFYSDYSLFKRELYRDLVKRNAKRLKNSQSQNEKAEDLNAEEQAELIRLEKNVKLTLFKKSQKLIDRFLFIFFAEDRGLLPPNSTVQILDKWKADIDFGDDRPLYNLFKQYFKFLDQGRQGTSSRAEIYAFNGGLFKEDTLLDGLEIDNELLYKYTNKLAAYDFESQVDVNILGHIFENSLNEIESVNAEIEGDNFDKQKSKRKKDGVFYTPKYITKYIVENTIGKLCEEKKVELEFKEEEYFKGRKNRNKATIEKLVSVLDAYRDWLLQLTICDPACGSGAFLNQALDFLIKEHSYIDELKTKVLGGGLQFPDIENTILENNIYGVDLNEESVEIAKLSLWLRTAQPRRKLNDLSSNIKCGNSLIDSKAVAGDKAFNWQTQFPQVFKEKDKKVYHITTAIHDSRTSARMVKYKVRERRDLGTNPYPNVIYFTPEDDELITKTIADVVKQDQLNVLAYNICADHIHLLLVCDIDDIPSIMQKIKSITANKVNKTRITREHAPLRHAPLRKGKKENKPLWQQKYSAPKEVTTEAQLQNTIRYIQNNRSKHELPEHSKALQNVISSLCTSPTQAFKTEYKGGFDVVIGNPPWNSKISPKDSSEIAKKYNLELKNLNMFAVFFYLGHFITKNQGIINLLVPEVVIKNSSYFDLRNLIINKYNFISLTDYGQFPGVASNTVAVCYQMKESTGNTIVSKIKDENNFHKTIRTEIFNKNPIKAFSFEIDNQKQNVLSKIASNVKLGEISKIKRGIELGQVTELVKCINCNKHTEISTKYYSTRDLNKCKYCDANIDINDKFSISSRSKTGIYNTRCLSGKEINRYIINNYYFIIPDLEGVDYKEEIFSKNNLFVKRIATKPEATIVNDKSFTFNTLYSIYDLKIHSKESLLVILNSKLISFYYE